MGVFFWSHEMTIILTKVLNGLPVKVEASIMAAEPSNGIFEPYIEEWDIIEVNGSPIKDSVWITKQMTPIERSRIECQLLRAFRVQPEYEP
jgi:hypothetical protein